MPDNDKQGVTNAQIMHSIGQLSGSVQAMHQGMTARIEDIRADIRRMEQSTNERIVRVEDHLSTQIKTQGEHLNKRVDDVDKRVLELEKEDKQLIAKVSKIGVLGGGISGALTAAITEIIKHL
jgi:tetrahydromethanopterin S-methyltransferase subunit G